MEKPGAGLNRDRRQEGEVWTWDQKTSDENLR